MSSEEKFINECKFIIFVVDVKTNNVIHSVLYEHQPETETEFASRVCHFMMEVFSDKSLSHIKKEMKNGNAQVCIPDEEGVEGYVNYLKQSEAETIVFHDTEAEKLLKKAYGKRK